MHLKMQKNEYDQEIPHSQTADQLTAPRERATWHLQLQDIQKTISSSYQLHYSAKIVIFDNVFTVEFYSH